MGYAPRDALQDNAPSDNAPRVIPPPLYWGEMKSNSFISSQYMNKVQEVGGIAKITPTRQPRISEGKIGSLLVPVRQ